MQRMFRVGLLVVSIPLLSVACAHDYTNEPPPQGTAVGTSPLAPFDSVNLPHPNSREQLAAALRQRGFFPASAPEGTTMNGAIRAFQKSEDLPQTGFPDDETLKRLGIDPATRDRTLDPSPVYRQGATGAGVSH